MKNAELKVTSGPLAGSKLPVTGRDMTIGRSQSCGIRVSGYEEVSREHARIRWEDGSFTVEDLDSRNGTLVDGEPVRKAALRNGSVLVLGDLTAELSIPAGGPQFEGDAVNESAKEVAKAEPARRPSEEQGVRRAPAAQRPLPIPRGAVIFVLLLGLFFVYRSRAATKTGPSPADVFVAPHSSPSGGNTPGSGGFPFAPPSGGGTTPPAPTPAPTPSPSPAPAPSGESGEQAAKDATVVIARRQSDGRWAIAGAGFLVGNHTVLTTRRRVCGDDSDTPVEVAVVFRPGASDEKLIPVPASEVHPLPLLHAPKDVVRDVAVIRIPDGAPVAPLKTGGAGGISPSQPVSVVGLTSSPGTPSTTLVTHTVQGFIRDQQTQRPAVLILNDVNDNDAIGSPVVDASGQVVAMVFSRLKGENGKPPSLACLTTDHIGELLQSMLQSR